MQNSFTPEAGLWYKLKPIGKRLRVPKYWKCTKSDAAGCEFLEISVIINKAGRMRPMGFTAKKDLTRHIDSTCVVKDEEMIKWLEINLTMKLL